MNNKELELEWNMDYYELLSYLKKKYGIISGSFFIKSAKGKYYENSSIKKSSKGLYIHHDFEYDPENDRVANLSAAKYADAFPAKYQLGCNLTYCNWLEHLILHIKINLLRCKQLGFKYFKDSVELILVPELNDMYNYNYNLYTIQDYKLMCFNLVQDDYEDYCWMVDEWLRLLGFENINWKNW